MKIGQKVRKFILTSSWRIDSRVDEEFTSEREIRSEFIKRMNSVNLEVGFIEV